MSLDESVMPGHACDKLQAVGEIERKAYIVTDSYPSRPGPLSSCQAGKETFLRVLAADRQLRETLSVKIESCSSNIELAESGLDWNPKSSDLRLKWLNAPGTAGTSGNLPRDRTKRAGFTEVLH